MYRWLLFFVSILVGVGLGVAYGWVINPPGDVNTSPETLRVDYITDYVLMVAESYEFNGDLALAISRLAVLGNPSPETSVQEAVDFALQVGYLESDIVLIETLLNDLRDGFSPAETEEP
jgi:hypothetical protein